MAKGRNIYRPPWFMQAQQYLDRGYSYRQIARMLGTVHTTTRYWLVPQFRERKKAYNLRRQQDLRTANHGHE
jgi:transposase-like protein